MKRQTLRSALATTVLFAATALAWTVAPGQAHAEPECLNSSNDFDMDGVVDIAVGLPGANNGAGAVQVQLSNDGDPTTSIIDAPAGAAGDRFGTAIAEVASAEGEVDQDRCTQLAVGAPGRDVGGNQDAGAVFLFKWDSSADEFVSLNEFTQGSDGVPGQASAGARYGAALAAPHHADDIGPLVTPLFVGAPGYPAAGQEGAGAVTRLEFSTGTEDPTVDDGLLLQQGANGMPGTSEAGDGLGTSLAVTDGGVLMGVPYEDVAGESEADAGGFIRWRANDSGDAKFITQNTANVPGSAEAGDRFGAAIYSARETTPSGGGHYVVVGAPGEAIGSVNNAGMALRFVYDGDLELAKTKAFHQNSTGVVGRPEAGDRFGSSFGSFGLAHLLTGVPGEDIGSIRNAGAVQSLGGGQGWNQDTQGVPGTAEARDRFGATMGNALYGMGSAGEDGWLGDVLVGTTGENDGAGVVIDGLPGGPAPSKPLKSQSPAAGNNFGAAIGKTN
ncbi:MAG: hypothetical protein GEV07_28745 [Streptosporangiales bacterium]|nr:hypothetical protein [Streptosporangiales bacterium]